MREPADLSRYHRQMLLPGWGEAAQRRLEESHALIVGCGALGCAAAELLARAGVGSLTIFDRDVVEPTNLQRQCLFDERDAADGIPKAQAAARRLGAINSQVWVTPVVADFNHRTAPRWFEPQTGRVGGAGPVGAIVDGTDNFQTRYLINDLSVKFGVPYVYGGAVGTTGMQATFVPGRTPCLRCVFPQMPEPGSQPTCDTAGVLGPVIQVVGGCQASDAIKVLMGRSDLIAPTLLEFDLWQGRRRRIDLSSIRPPGGANECPCCGQRQFEFLDGAGAQDLTVLCGTDSVQVMPPERPQGAAALDLGALGERLRGSGKVAVNAFLLRATLDGERSERPGKVELTVFPDGRAIVKGVVRPESAKAIYARYVGA